MRYAPIDPTKVKGPPWVAQEFDAWLEVAAALEKPWPRKAAIMDLRWWKAALQWGSIKRIPGWEVMAKRWGWVSEWQTRSLMANEAEWAPLTKTSTIPPVSLQYPSTMGTDERQESGKNIPYPSTIPPVSLNARVPLVERREEESRDQNPPTPHGGDGEARELEIVVKPAAAPTPAQTTPVPALSAPQEGASTPQGATPALPNIQTPAPRPASGHYGPSTVRVGDKELPGDLPALLTGIKAGRVDVISALLGCSVTDTAGLLLLSLEELRYCRGIGPATANAIGAWMSQRWGVDMPQTKRRFVATDDLTATVGMRVDVSDFFGTNTRGVAHT